MKRIYILVEGQTEETFIRDVLKPHLASYVLDLTPIIIATKRTQTGPKFKGGLPRYRLVRSDLKRLLDDSSVSMITTMFDYYQLPADFPGLDRVPSGSCYTRVEHLEKAFAADIGDHRFLPFLTLHEFEALIFTDPKAIADAIPDKSIAKHLLNVKAKFSSPEEINDGQNTHPAARILSYAKGYQKALHGPVIANRIGLDAIRRECPHFNQWITRLEALAQEN